MSNEVDSPMLAVELATCEWLGVPHTEFQRWTENQQVAAMRSWLQSDEGRP